MKNFERYLVAGLTGGYEAGVVLGADHVATVDGEDRVAAAFVGDALEAQFVVAPL